MKHLLLACICLLFGMSSWAKVVTIHLHDADHEAREIDRRSVSISPVITHNESVFSIYFPVSVTHFQVTVKDAVGNMVYVNIVTEPSKYHVFEISSPIAGGEYRLEIEIGDQSYYGNFSI